LLAQRWAERRRTLLVICPANLRKQWSQELLDKFFLPSTILETKTFNEAVRAGNLKPRTHRTGRNVQFNSKVTAETNAKIYKLADEKEVTLGELLEMAMAALEREGAAG
jgi:endonuclease/exonuclease/phosphatase (EEP) superfamily protein YafD